MLLILCEALSFTLAVIVLFFSFFKALAIFLMTEDAFPFALIEMLLDFNFLRDLEIEEIVFFAFPLTLIEMLLDFMLDKDFLIESIVFLAFPLTFTLTSDLDDCFLLAEAEDFEPPNNPFIPFPILPRILLAPLKAEEPMFFVPETTSPPNFLALDTALLYLV